MCADADLWALAVGKPEIYSGRLDLNLVHFSDLMVVPTVWNRQTGG
jgi:hypothetical protein